MDEANRKPVCKVEDEAINMCRQATSLVRDF
jgi:hypothetical protein